MLPFAEIFYTIQNPKSGIIRVQSTHFYKVDITLKLKVSRSGPTHFRSIREDNELSCQFVSWWRTKWLLKHTLSSLKIADVKLMILPVRGEINNLSAYSETTLCRYFSKPTCIMGKDEMILNGECVLVCLWLWNYDLKDFSEKIKWFQLKVIGQSSKLNMFVFVVIGHNKLHLERLHTLKNRIM